MIDLIYNIKKKPLQLPQEWNELTTKQLVGIAVLLQTKTDGVQQLIKAFKILTGSSIYNFMRLPKDIIVNACEQIKWLLEDNTLTKQLLPTYTFNKPLSITYYAPDSHFDNLIMSEFNHAEMAYQNLAKEKSSEYLDQLVAIIYREGKPNYNHKRNADGDHRIPFSYGDISWHMGRVARWPEAVKHAIVLWYDGCRQELVKAYPLIFKNNANAVDENLYEGLFGMMHNVAGEKYGTFEEVEKSYVHKILMALSIMIDEAEQMKKSMAQ